MSAELPRDPDVVRGLSGGEEAYTGHAGIVISDFDGVMAPQGCKDISHEAVEAVHGFRELGYRFGLASGKPLSYLYSCCSEHGIAPDFIIAENGGVVYMDGTKIRHPPEDVRSMRNILSLDRGGFQGGPGRKVMFEEEKDVIYTPHMEGGMEGALETKDYFDGLIEEHGFQLDTYAHPDGAVDVVPRGMSKVKGIERVRHRYPEGMTIAIGDGTNDIEMLSSVDFPATVGNANPKVAELVSSRGGYIASHRNGKGFREIDEFVRSQGSGLLAPAERGLAVPAGISYR
jgi:hydroxymethylpyrimidine pyrophosphatase-like HAD family hydrolase